MIRTIARKEATEMLRDGRFRWAAGIVFALLLGSLIAGFAHHVATEADRAAAQAADRQVWLAQGEKNQHSAAHFGIYAFKPTTSLTAADPGVLPYTGVAVFMEAHSVKDASFRPAEDATAIQRLGSLTAASTLQLLVPLLIILLAFPAFAGEREDGTLRQLLSLGVSPQTLAAGKAFGVALPLAFVVVPAAGLGVAAMALWGGESVDAGRLALWAGVYVLYATVVLALALLASAWAPSPRVALVSLLGFWLVTGFVVPRLTADAAEALHPTPTATAFSAAIDADMKAFYAAAADARTGEAPLSAGASLLHGEQTETEINRRHLATLADTYRAQQRVTQAGTVFSPLLAVQLLSMGLAGSDYPHHRHFADAAELYRYDYVQRLNQDMVDRDAGWDYLADAETWAAIPPFDYTLPGAAWAVGRYGASAGALALWALGLLAALALTLRHLRVA